MADKVIIDRRLCLTEDKSHVVDETDPAARWLWAIPGQIVDRALAERLGALQAPESPAVEPAPAEEETPKRRRGRPPGSTKQAKLDEDKSASPGEDKGGLSFPPRTRRS
ncbi:MAG TPA: hypothetical protein VK045_02550 [Ornithinicoccus sp.]|nr:hypothetical protein [Ornithinicoccus sp.]